MLSNFSQSRSQRKGTASSSYTGESGVEQGNLAIPDSLGVTYKLLLAREDTRSGALGAGGIQGETCLSSCSWALWLVDLSMNDQLKLPVKATPTVPAEVAPLTCMALAVDDQL